MFHPAKKLIIVTEHFISEKVCEIIETEYGKGYTMVPAGGKGLHHLRSTSDRATVIEGFDNLKIEVVIQDQKIAEKIAQQVLTECFEDFSGIMYLEDVQIVRTDRF